MIGDMGWVATLPQTDLIIKIIRFPLRGPYCTRLIFTVCVDAGVTIRQK